MKSWPAVLVFCLCISIFPATGLAQSLFVTKEKIMMELEKRELEYDAVVERLKERGVDLTYIDEKNITQEQIAVIQEVILEMETDKIEKEQEKQRKDEELLDEAEPEIDSLEMDLNSEEELEKEEEKEEIEVTIYGQQLFLNNILELQSSPEEIRAPDSYVLGPGDEMVISIWGRSQFDDQFEIDESGYIKILKGGKRVYLKGLTLGKAKEKLYKIFNEYYSFSQGQFDVAVNFSRTVKVSIWGEVRENPGSFALPAFNSAFNALAAVRGTNDIGSMRNILLQKSNGDSKVMDIYEYMKNPGISQDYYLDENDVIVVPVAEKVVSIEGAVRRPLKYELIVNEGVKELLEYAGGFREDAFRKKIQVNRQSNDERKIIDLDWREYERTNRNFELEDGDLIMIESIETEAENIVEILGVVAKPGIYQRSNSMKVKDLITKAGMTSNSNTEVVYLSRTNLDGSVEYKKLNLQSILDDAQDPDNILLKDKDKLEVWDKGRFTDEQDIAVDGSVRYPGKFSYDQSNSMRVTDAITLAGGMRRDASNFAIIHRNDPLNPKVKSYKTISDLDQLFEDESTEDNFILSPFDSLVVKSKNTFLEESFVRIEGAVNSPGEFQYGQDMSIRDLMTLAGGFKMAASTNNIEISRVIIENNKPTRTIVANLELDRNFNVINKGDNEYALEPFDNIAVRFIKEFQLQRRVFMEGEVAYPGPYAISRDNEQILSIIERAGGLTDEAFPAGSTLLRADQDYGSVVIKLEEIIKNPNSQFNFFVKNGDRIFVPKIKEFVTIKGATRAREVVGEESINEGNVIHVPYHKGKDAMFYINEYAGGLHENADKQKIFVEHANGEIKRPKSGFLIKRYPKVQQGSMITVGFKSLEKNEKDKKSDVDWTKVLGDSVAQAMSILTLILLIQRLD